MLKIKCLNNEKGVALITSIMLLSLLTIIGFSAMNSSDIELRIAGNERAAAQAFALAEAGIDHTIAQLQIDIKAAGTRDFSSLGVHDYDDVNDEPYLANQPLGSGLYNVSLKYINDNDIKLRSTGGFAGSSSVIEVALELNSSTPPLDPAFGYGIITDGDMSISGRPNIVAPLVHANGTVSQTGSGTITGDVSAGESLSVGSTVSGTTESNADLIDVPFISEKDFDEWRALALDGSNYFSGNPTITLSGDQAGKIIFADGDITIDGASEYSNITIVATGNVRVNGRSILSGDDKIRVAMIAGGDILFNGANNSYAVYWSNGTFRQNGASLVHGSIVSNGVTDGGIDINGRFNFTFNGNIDNNYLPEDENAKLPIEVTSWADKSFLNN